MRQTAGVRALVEGPEERILLAAIAALLIAGLAAGLLIPGDLDRRAIAQEAGSLLAPPSEGSFTDAFGRPSAPTSAIPGPGVGAPNDPSGGGAPPPGTPGITPPPNPAPEEPPEDDGILGFLPDLPILPPPPLLGSDKARRGAWRLR